MSETGKPFDLEERTFLFAQRVRAFVRRLPPDLCNREDSRQLVRASGSVGANYIEANESMSRKDFIAKARISRREAKESRHFLRLLYTAQESELEQERCALVQEAGELIRILSSMIGPRRNRFES
ncbi:MAG: four helix bundle protein [Tepidisphaeraceae bacterium]